jgi:thiamine-phosphate pyrophosphorylase
MRPRVDLRLYALADPAMAATPERLPDIVREAIEGGATLVQLRDKASDARLLIERARDLLDVTGPRSVPLLINDRVDVALASGADGVHLGQEDMPPAIARRILGADAIIGLTVRSEAEAQAAPIADIDYAAIGGVFATSSKENAATPIGLDGLALLAAVLRDRAPGLPLCAIAGITRENAAAVISAGADGVAVISSLLRAVDVRSAARKLREAVDHALAERTTP